MKANYDNYDYLNYWRGRGYEHASEEMAIRGFLKNLPEMGRMADMGGGFGRLVRCFQESGKIREVVIVEPSGKLISQAKERFGDEIGYIQSDIEQVGSKIDKGSFELISMVRVMHHIEDAEQAMRNLHYLLRKGGYLIFEFANKLHWKAVFSNMCCGNFTYPLEIDPDNKNSRKNMNCLPFFNYHPDVICQKLEDAGFAIVSKKSVSNVRSALLKNILPDKVMLGIEKCMQDSLAGINFGPSVFVLAKKVR